jgi:hypothetical protein
VGGVGHNEYKFAKEIKSKRKNVEKKRKKRCLSRNFHLEGELHHPHSRQQVGTVEVLALDFHRGGGFF